MSDRILLVDDEPFILSGYKRGLGRHYTVDTANGGADAIRMFEQLESDSYAVVVSDMRMPEMDGVELLNRLADSHPETVRIMLTGNSDQQTAIDAVNHGRVFKFLTKPCSASELKSTLEQALAHYRREREKADASAKDAIAVDYLNAKLSHQSRHDILTGLSNRYAFEEALKSALKGAGANSQTHIFGFLDVDHFHRINDICGYTAGDELLRQLGSLLSHHRRSDDIIARLGSDQFGLILKDSTLEQGEAHLQMLHEKFKQFTFHWDENSYDLSISIGLIPIDSTSESVAALFSAAETACNVAKDQGRNRIHIGDANDMALTQRLNEMQWVTRIIQALKEDRFHLYHQTIEAIDPGEQEGEHYEILLRMEGRSGELISPADFMPAAENYQLSPRLDRWVVAKTINWLNENPDHLERLAVCSINLSGLSMGDQETLGFIRRTLEHSNVPPSKICFEVTETAAISNLDAAVRFMHTLKSIGVLFSLDDFGTGLSSFAYLRTLPVDYLKIDGTFVKQIDRSIVDWTMVKSINEMGQIMGKRTIAEFVENEEIYSQLSEIGVNYAQGFLLSEPRPLIDKN